MSKDSFQNGGSAAFLLFSWRADTLSLKVHGCSEAKPEVVLYMFGPCWFLPWWVIDGVCIGRQHVSLLRHVYSSMVRNHSLYCDTWSLVCNYYVLGDFFFSGRLQSELERWWVIFVSVHCPPQTILYTLCDYINQEFGIQDSAGVWTVEPHPLPPVLIKQLI